MRHEALDTDPLLSDTEAPQAEFENPADEAQGRTRNKDAQDAHAQRRRNRNLDMGITIVIPWCCAMVTLLMYLFYSDMKFLIWLLLSLIGTCSVWLILLGAAARHGAFLFLGLATLASIIVGAVMGMQINQDYLNYYRTLHDGVTYENVDAYSDAVAKVDVGVLKFDPGTLVDDRRTIGFVAEGIIHCVAPIGREDHRSHLVQYWAAGIDCCEKRSNFDCGTAMEPNATVAILAQPSGYFDKAVQEAASVYNITSAPEAHLVSFVHKAAEATDSVWDDAVSTVMVVAVTHFLAMFIIAFFVFQVAPTAMKPKSDFIKYRLLDGKIRGTGRYD